MRIVIVMLILGTTAPILAQSCLDPFEPTCTPTPTDTYTPSATPTPSDTPTPTPDIVRYATLAPIGGGGGEGQATAFVYQIDAGQRTTNNLLMLIIALQVCGLFLRVYIRN